MTSRTVAARARCDQAGASDGKLDIAADDHVLASDALDAPATLEPEVGLHVTATPLDSDRSGGR